MLESLHHALRPARVEDSEPIAELLAQLEYPTTVLEVRGRLERLLAREDGAVLVAEANGAVAAVAAYQLVWLLERTRPQCRLTTLVVNSAQRRTGLARALVTYIEAEARAAGCFRLEVTTQASRADALAFYADFGFIERPRRLVKVLER